MVKSAFDDRVEDMMEVLGNLSELVDRAADSGDVATVDSVISSLENCSHFVRQSVG